MDKAVIVERVRAWLIEQRDRNEYSAPYIDTGDDAVDAGPLEQVVVDGELNFSALIDVILAP